jgi:hypothetical protein
VVYLTIQKEKVKKKTKKTIQGIGLSSTDFRRGKNGPIALNWNFSPNCNIKTLNIQASLKFH